MNYSLRSGNKVVFAGLLCILISSTATGQLIQYDFNSGTGTIANQGSIGSAGDLTLAAGADFSSDGGGVTGNTGDYAYVGVAAADSHAKSSAVVSGLDNLSTITFTGWINTSASNWTGNTGTGARTIISWQDGWAKGMRLTLQGDGSGSGELGLEENNFNDAVSSTGGIWDNTGDWIFFAVTWNGSSASATDAINFYYGTAGTSVSLVSTADRTTSTSGLAGDLTLGNSDGTAHWEALVGSLDDIRLYDSVLDASTIEGIRASTIPEPSALFLLLAGAAALLASNRTKRP